MNYYRQGDICKRKFVLWIFYVTETTKAVLDHLCNFSLLPFF